jgi:hypothetical protein
MSADPGAAASSGPAADPGPASDAGPAANPAVEPAHAHAWAGMRFELVDGHAFVIETCESCGHVRRYRAFERFWDPAAPSIAPSAASDGAGPR